MLTLACILTCYVWLDVRLQKRDIDCRDSRTRVSHRDIRCQAARHTPTPCDANRSTGRRRVCTPSVAADLKLIRSSKACLSRSFSLTLLFSRIFWEKLLIIHSFSNGSLARVTRDKSSLKGLRERETDAQEGEAWSHF